MWSQLRKKIISGFKNLYENYKHHLPDSVGIKIETIKGLSNVFKALSGQVYGEMSKIVAVNKQENDSYTLISQGFLSVFRGRAGIIDCSFDEDKGTPYTRAMHEDNKYYFVYKGKELKGYVGLCLGKDEKGEKILTIDTINSPSLDGEELLMNLLKELHHEGKKLGCIGIALPSSLDKPFNFDNRETIENLDIYKKGRPIKVTPVHKESWDKFTNMFGKDTYNSIEYGSFKLLNIEDLR